MKLNKKFVPILLIVIMLAVVFVAPVAAQSGNPPVANTPATQMFDMTYISQLLQALILATVPVLAGMAARWLSARAKLELTYLSVEQRAAFDIFIKTLIYAAEQMKAQQFINDKLAYVTEQAQAWLKIHEMEMSAEEMRAQIEAAVLREFNFPRLTADKKARG